MTKAAAIVAIRARNGWCRRITDGSIKEKVSPGAVLNCRRSAGKFGSLQLYTFPCTFLSGSPPAWSPLALVAVTAHLAGAPAAVKAQGGQGGRRLRAHRRQHHARAETGRLSADRAPLVRRFLAPLFRMAPAGRRRGVDLGGRARRRPAAQAHRRGAPQRAAGQRPLGRGAPPRPVRRSRRHRAARHGRGHAPPDHAHHRQRSESALGAPRNGDHLHPRQQPVRRPARQRRDRAADRRAAAQARSARYRQPEVHQGRRAEADRAHADRGGEEEEGRREGQGAARCRSSSSPIGSRRPTCSSRPTASTSSSSSSSAPSPPSVPTCRTTSPSRATPRTSRRAPSSATRRTFARCRS